MKFLPFELCTFLLGCNLLSAAPPAIAPGIYGTNLHMIDRIGEDMENYRNVLETMRAEGCTWGRSDHYWITNEPNPGTWDFTQTDLFFQDAKAAGIHIMPILAAADLHLPTRAKPLSLHGSEYQIYLEKFVTRYRNSVTCYQVANEPNSGGPNTRQLECENPQTYLKLLKLCHDTIKAVDPEITVVHAGLIGIDNELTAFDYLEQELAAGMASFCDVLSIHPYLESNYPEEIYPNGMEKLNRLLKQYKADHKPIWVTELGDSIGTPPEWEKFYPTAFAQAGINPAKTTLVVIEDPEWNFYTEGWMINAENLGAEFRNRRKITMEELKTLPPDSVLLLGTNGDFPSPYYAALQDYLRRGGTIVSNYTMPLYFELKRRQDGTMERRKVEGLHMADLHLGWEAFWTQPEIPRNFSKLRSAFPDMTDFSRFQMAGRVLSAKNLKPGDQLIPLIYAEDGEQQWPVAGVYRFNSDLKGNAIISLCWGYPFKARTEISSARTWPRAILLLRAGGIDKIFPYKFRIHKNRTRQDYGYHEWDLKPHAGAIALQTLFKHFPEHTKITIVQRGNPWIAKGIRPDGSTVHAIWLRHGDSPFRLSAERLPERVETYLGEEMEWNQGELSISDAPIYVTGPQSVVSSNNSMQ